MVKFCQFALVILSGNEIMTDYSCRVTLSKYCRHLSRFVQYNQYKDAKNLLSRTSRPGAMGTCIWYVASPSEPLPSLFKLWPLGRKMAPTPGVSCFIYFLIIHVLTYSLYRADFGTTACKEFHISPKLLCLTKSLHDPCLHSAQQCQNQTSPGPLRRGGGSNILVFITKSVVNILTDILHANRGTLF